MSRLLFLLLLACISIVIIFIIVDISDVVIIIFITKFVTIAIITTITIIMMNTVIYSCHHYQSYSYECYYSSSYSSLSHWYYFCYNTFFHQLLFLSSSLPLSSSSPPTFFLFFPLSVAQKTSHYEHLSTVLCSLYMRLTCHRRIDNKAPLNTTYSCVCVCVCVSLCRYPERHARPGRTAGRQRSAAHSAFRAALLTKVSKPHSHMHLTTVPLILSPSLWNPSLWWFVGVQGRDEVVPTAICDQLRRSFSEGSHHRHSGEDLRRSKSPHASHPNNIKIRSLVLLENWRIISDPLPHVGCGLLRWQPPPRLWAVGGDVSAGAAVGGGGGPGGVLLLSSQPPPAVHPLRGACGEGMGGGAGDAGRLCRPHRFTDLGTGFRV